MSERTSKLGPRLYQLSPQLARRVYDATHYRLDSPDLRLPILVGTGLALASCAANPHPTPTPASCETVNILEKQVGIFIDAKNWFDCNPEVRINIHAKGTKISGFKGGVNLDNLTHAHRPGGKVQIDVEAASANRPNGYVDLQRGDTSKGDVTLAVYVDTRKDSLTTAAIIQAAWIYANTISKDAHTPEDLTRYIRELAIYYGLPLDQMLTDPRFPPIIEVVQTQESKLKNRRLAPTNRPGPSPQYQAHQYFLANQLRF